METNCPDCGYSYNSDMIKELGGACPKCMADLLRSQTDFLDASEADQPSNDAPPLEPGSTFKGMEVISLLGRGGMGYVYEAKQTKLDRTVALKILDPRLADAPGFAERFNREAKALAALSHPNIVQVFDYGHEGKHHFLVMEYIDGANLREILLTSRIEPKTALRYVPQICDALEYAHGAGIIHRDVKPENILIDTRGTLKIADFGLAKMVSADGSAARVTLTKQVMGTPNYMAPEQMTAMSAVDHRADIYSLGVVFYEMLTGELPVGRFPNPSEAVQVDVRLDAVVLKALEKDPQRRYQQASQIKDDVSHATSPAATPPAPPSSPRTAEKSSPPSVADKLRFASTMEVVWLGYLISIIGLFIPIIDVQICSLIGGGIIAFSLLQLPRQQRELHTAGIYIAVEVAVTLLMSVIGVLALVFSPISLLGVPLVVIMVGCSLIGYWKIMGAVGTMLADAGHQQLAQSTHSARVGYVVYSVAALIIVTILGLGIGIALTQLPSNDRAIAHILVPGGIALLALPIHWLFGWFFVLRPIRRACKALRGEASERKADDSSGTPTENAPSPVANTIRRIGSKAASAFSMLALVASLACLALSLVACLYLMPRLIANAEMLQLALPGYAVLVINTLQTGQWYVLAMGLAALILLVKEMLLWSRPWTRLLLNLPALLGAVLVTAALAVCAYPLAHPRLSYRSAFHNSGLSEAWGSAMIRHLEQGIVITDQLDGKHYTYLLADTRPPAQRERRLDEKTPLRIFGCTPTEAGVAVYHVGKFGIPDFSNSSVTLIERPPVDHVAVYLLNKDGERVTTLFPANPAILEKVRACRSVEEALALLPPSP